MCRLIFTTETVNLLAGQAIRLHPLQSVRLLKAAELLKTGKVSQTTPGTWKVQGSQETPYTVTYDAAMGWSCDCKDAVCRDHTCKHAAACGLAEKCARYQATHLDPVPAPVAPAPLPAAPTPPAQPSSEATFSLTLRGTIHGQDALLTARGQTLEAFQANVAAIQAMLDSPKVPPVAPGSTPTAEGYCLVHQVQMRQTTKQGQSWYSHKTADGTWCKGKGVRP